MFFIAMKQLNMLFINQNLCAGRQFHYIHVSTRTWLNFMKNRRCVMFMSSLMVQKICVYASIHCWGNYTVV